MTRLYYADVSQLDESRVFSAMSSYHRNKLEKIRDPSLRRQTLGVERLLILAVRELVPEAALPLRIGMKPSGQPFFEDLPFFFSLSHSGKMAACAISDQPIGVDVQRQRQGTPALIRRCFTEDEQQVLHASKAPKQDFTLLWTRKESLVKMTGEGLRRPLNSFSVLEETTRFWHMNIGEYTFCVCTASGSAPDPIQEKKLL